MGLAALLLALVLVYVATRVPPRTHAGEPPPPPPETAQAVKPEIRVTPSQIDRLQTRTANSLRRASEFTEVEQQEGLVTAVLRDSALADLIFVRVGRFEMSSYETPNVAYARCVEAKACRAPAARGDLKDLSKRYHPVAGVSWQDADTFCRWIGGRLPTEAEWNAADVGPPVAGEAGAAPVPSGQPNRLGLYGLAGNVEEWLAADENGLKVLRGAARETAPAGSRSPAVGFRCAR
jgi:formylglycine-generating enzyme required for sulfatase activity